MKLKINYIPLLIASSLSLHSLTATLALNIYAGEEVFYNYSNPILIGAAGIIFIWCSMFLKRGIWVYLFLLLLIASFSEKVNFNHFILWISIGSLKIHIIPLILLVSHVLLNAKRFRNNQTAREKQTDFETGIEYFEKKFSSKTTLELKTLKESDLVPEAQEAIKRLLEIQKKN